MSSRQHHLRPAHVDTIYPLLGSPPRWRLKPPPEWGEWEGGRHYHLVTPQRKVLSESSGIGTNSSDFGRVIHAGNQYPQQRRPSVRGSAAASWSLDQRVKIPADQHLRIPREQTTLNAHLPATLWGGHNLLAAGNWREVFENIDSTARSTCFQVELH